MPRQIIPFSNTTNSRHILADCVYTYRSRGNCCIARIGEGGSPFICYETDGEGVDVPAFDFTLTIQDWTKQNGEVIAYVRVQDSTLFLR